MIRQVINFLLPSYIRGLGVTAAVIGGVAAVGSAAISARASKKAAGQQQDSADDAINFQREALAQTREDLAPFRNVGADVLPGLSELTTDAEAQKQFVTENPFFDALADDAQKRIFNNQAAKGKVGSGGTAEALQNSLLLLGPQLVQQGIDNRFNLATMGANAAARLGTATQQTGRTISDLTTQAGNAQAAGTVGQANAIAGGIEGIASAAGGYYSGLGGTTSAGIGGGGGQGVSSMFGTQTANI